MDPDVFLPRRAPARPRSAARLVAAVAALRRVVPRGKGAIPRLIGRWALPGGAAHGRYMTTRHGTKLLLSHQAMSVYATMHESGLAWDYHDFEICMGLAPDDTVFYDIGANVGYEALEMCRLRAGGAVYAFEPHRELAALIAASAALNGFDALHVSACLLGDADGAHDFYLAPDSIHASAVADSGRPVVATRQSAMFRIDTLVGTGAMPAPHAVKMDTEGSEHLIFAGGAETFRAHAPHVFLEFATTMDPGGRVRAAIEALVGDVARYRLYGYPKRAHAAAYPARLFAIERGAQWDEVHGLVLRNTESPVRDERLFG